MISFLLKELDVFTDEIIIHFITEAKICLLHKEFFDDPASTDCITFPIDSPEKKSSYHVLGEVFICPKVALAYSKKHSIAPYKELCRYLIHCVLHLIGYEDTEVCMRAKMKAKEYLMLKKVDQAGLIFIPKNFTGRGSTRAMEP